MAEGQVQLPADGPGKKLLLFGPNGDDRYSEAVVLVDGDGNHAFAPENPRSSVLTSTSLAAGVSVDLDAASVTVGRTGMLLAVDFSASVPLKVEVQVVTSGGGRVNRVVAFTSDMKLYDRFETPHRRFVTLAGAVTSFFGVRVTNQDPVDAGDVYATVWWDEVT